MRRKFISFGTKEFDIDKFRSVENGSHKPRGGFWTCDFKEDGFWYSAWEKFVVAEEVGGYGVGNAVLFSIKDDAKIYQINTREDYIHLFQRYALINETTLGLDDFGYVSSVNINFEEMLKDYDGMELTEEGLNNIQTFDPIKWDWNNPRCYFYKI